MARTTSRHGVIPRSGALNMLNGIHAPMYMKQPQLSSRSITVKNIWSCVSVLKCPSQLIADPAKRERFKKDVTIDEMCNVPAANAARRSSLPSVRVNPTVNSARARY